jgi:5-formyltetrahydrofolate cyclo-ligase
VLSAHEHIALHYPVGNEVDLRPLAHALWQQDKKLYLPILDGQLLQFGAYTPDTAFINNKFNIPEPDTTAIAPKDLNAVIFPMVAFDEACHRIGMGGGFYDRTFTFTKLKPGPTLMGCAFECQKVDAITPEAWDVSLDCVITEKIIYMPE